ncbi:hypothetical protein AVEN_175712-1 [Araneus ventricosus]|uniref:Uncharacterized protein n=1 Tax=Araneus ventricosus TaxID=182803 RepID=A0A4Y2GA08_ARAVE|nr:hypothetical protein AVEN_175712-1 [Araneus ventricosus]
MVTNLSCKILSIASHYFSHFSGNMWIPHRKKGTSLESNHESIRFGGEGYPHNNGGAAQTSHELSIGIGGNRKEAQLRQAMSHQLE